MSITPKSDKKAPPQEIALVDVSHAHTSEAPVCSRLGFEAYLVANTTLTPEMLEFVSQEAKSSGRCWLSIISEIGGITPQTLIDMVSTFTGAEAITPDTGWVEPSLLECFPRSTALHIRSIPISLIDGILTCGMVDIFDIKARDILRNAFPASRMLRVKIMVESDFFLAMENLYGQAPVQTVTKSFEEDSAVFQDGASRTHHLASIILEAAIQQRASDIHCEPEPTYSRIRLRIDGVLELFHIATKDQWSTLIIHLKILAGMDITQTRNSQDGRFTHTSNHRKYDCRVSSHPTIHGENIVIRLLDTSRCPTFQNLGISSTVGQILLNHIQKPQGFMLFTGPTGSGKTSTMHALLRQLDTASCNIMTLEDPVEMILSQARQTDLSHYGSFAQGVRAILRQAPDVILIGEMRDSETARMAMQAALTGHKVLSTLHTADAFGAFQRLHDLEVSQEICAETLSMIVSQRLVRKLCEHCKEPSEDFPINHWVAIGCSQCRYTGYHERIPLIDLLSITYGLRRRLRKTLDRDLLMDQAFEDGYQPIQVMAQELLEQGLTSLVEIRRHLRIDHAKASQKKSFYKYSSHKRRRLRDKTLKFIHSSTLTL